MGSLPLSSGANLSAGMMISILESAPDSPFYSLPPPVSILWMYAALDFNFTSWMSDENLRILRHDPSVAKLPGGILEAKNHLEHQSPLSVVADRPSSSTADGKRIHRRNNSLAKSFANLPSKVATWTRALTPKLERHQSDVELSLSKSPVQSSSNDDESTDSEPLRQMSREKSLSERVLYHEEDSPGRSESPDVDDDRDDETDREVSLKPKSAKAGKGKKAFGTRLTMTSRTGYFNDRIISPSMVSHLVLISFSYRSFFCTPPSRSELIFFLSS